MKQNTQYDCCVVGGGMVGAAIALGLAQQSYKVALIEKQVLCPFSVDQSPDMRVSALNMHSVNLLNKLDAWRHVLKMRYQQYDSLAVWDAQGPMAGNLTSATRFSASEINQASLGYFVENRLIQLALFDEISRRYQDKIDCIHAQTIVDINAVRGEVLLSNKQTIEAKLIIGADGADSAVRDAAKIATSGWHYSQHANAILIQTQAPLPSETWQAFYKSGPRALLPMYDNYACLVWYDNFEQSKWIQNAPKAQLSDAIKTHFPALTEPFQIVNVAGFSLSRMHAKQYGRHKAVIIGDAAHIINPLAGQGVNLGFKDVAALLDIIARQGITQPKTLIMAFEKKRKLPNLAMMTAMDLIYSGFSNAKTPVQIMRGLGLHLANQSGPIKRQALKYAMGL